MSQQAAASCEESHTYPVLWPVLVGSAENAFSLCQPAAHTSEAKQHAVSTVLVTASSLPVPSQFMKPSMLLSQPQSWRAEKAVEGPSRVGACSCLGRACFLAPGSPRISMLVSYSMRSVLPSRGIAFAMAKRLPG